MQSTRILTPVAVSARRRAPALPGDTHVPPCDVSEALCQLARILAEQDRRRLEAFLEVAIDVLDAIDGDADDADGNGAEDEGCAWFALLGDGPGCQMGDPGASDQVFKERPEYVDDQSNGPINDRSAYRTYQHEVARRGRREADRRYA